MATIREKEGKQSLLKKTLLTRKISPVKGEEEEGNQRREEKYAQ